MKKLALPIFIIFTVTMLLTSCFFKTEKPLVRAKTNDISSTVTSEEVMNLIKSDKTHDKIKGIKAAMNSDVDVDAILCQALTDCLIYVSKNDEAVDFILSSYERISEPDADLQHALLTQFNLAADNKNSNVMRKVANVARNKPFENNVDFANDCMILALQQPNDLDALYTMAAKTAPSQMILDLAAQTKSGVPQISNETKNTIYVEYMRKATSAQIREDKVFPMSELFMLHNWSGFSEYDINVLSDILLRPFDFTGCSQNDYYTCLSGETGWKYSIVACFSDPYVHSGRALNDFLIYISQDDIYEIVTSSKMLTIWYGDVFQNGLGNVQSGDADLGNALHKVFIKYSTVQERTDGHGICESLIDGLGSTGYTPAAKDISEYFLATITPEHFWVINSGLETLFALDIDIALDTTITMLSEGGYNDASYLAHKIAEQEIDITKEQMFMVIDRDVNEQTSVLAIAMLNYFGEEMIDERFATYLEKKLISPAASEGFPVRFLAARMLHEDYDKDIETFKEYFDTQQLDIIAGAYKIAYGYVDDSVLIDALLTYGDKEMAEHFLYTFRGAVEEWAKANNYMIVGTTIR